MRFFKAIKVAFRKKESNPEMVSKLIGKTIARGEYISKYGSIDDGFSLGEPYKNERGDWRYNIIKEEVIHIQLDKCEKGDVISHKGNEYIVREILECCFNDNNSMSVKIVVSKKEEE